MTLFLRLVTTAAVIPLATIAFEVSRLGLIGSIVGIGVAAAIGAAQFVGQHRFSDWIEDKLNDGWRAESFVIAYYVAILAIGILCAQATRSIARIIVDR